MEIEKLKQIARNKKITYNVISEKSGLPLNTIKSIFSFRVQNPRIDTLQAIEKALGITEGAVDNSVVLTDEELRLLAAYKKLVPSMQEYILGLIEGITGRDNADEKRA